MKDDRHRPLEKHVYGAKSALFIRADTNRRGMPTVSIDAAFAGDTPIGDSREYDWNNKLAVQLTQSELPALAAVLSGYVNECTFAARGKSQKGFEVTNQGGHFFVRLWAGSNFQHQVRMGHEDAFYACGILLHQLQVMLGCTAQTVDISLRAYARSRGTQR